jgi:RNA polymerase sigma-70 factor (ECF subfamily)
MSHGHIPVEDRNAIALALTGDQSAFAVLIARYQHMVHTVTSRVLRNEMDAEEATQDAFVKAFQALAEFQGAGKFSTWLYSIAYRTAITALRKRRAATLSIEDLRFHGVEPAEAAQLPQDRLAIIEQALAALSPEDAAIVTMYYLEELSVQEIVTITGTGASNVKVKLHRCRKKLFTALQYLLKDETWTLSANA